MEKAILAAYSGLALTSLMCFLISLLVIERLVKNRNFTSTFWITVSFSMSWLGEFILRTWWTIWKYRLISREPSAWMINHVIVLVGILLMLASGIILIKALTEHFGDVKVLIFTCLVVLYIVFFVYVTG